MIGQVFEALNCHLETVIASIREPQDFGGIGIPTEVDGQTEIKLEAPAWAKRVQRASDAFMKKWKQEHDPLVTGGVFIDEASCTPPAVQGSLLRVVLEKWVGEFKLDDNIKFIAAANPPEEAAGGWDMAIPLAGRFVHLEHVAPSAQEWIAWLNGAPINIEIVELKRLEWEKAFVKAKSLVAGYIQKFPGNLMEDPAQDEARFPQAYASPRTWDTAIRLYASCLATGREDLALTLVTGCIGTHLATKFLTWVSKCDLPDPEVLIADPDSWEPDPRRPDATFVVLNAVAQAVADSKKYVKDAEYGRRYVNAFRVIEKGTEDDQIILAGRALVKSENRPKKSGLQDPAVKKLIIRLAPVMKAAGLMDNLL
jgi:hypothetical protein